MHRTGELLAELFFHTGETVKSLNLCHTYAIDSFPVVACHNIRIPRNRLLKDKMYRGCCASKRCYFYGFNVHIIVTADGTPVEYTFTAGNAHDMDGIRQLPLNLPDGSEIPADAACTDYDMEEMLADNGIRLLAARKANSRHPHHPCTEYLIATQRKRIETAFSNIDKLMPKFIHAVTAEGFLSKLIAFFWAYTFIIIENL
jgi:hypothetical protein